MSSKNKIKITEIIKNGLDDPANEQTFSMNIWQKKLYFGTRNKKNGSRLYSLNTNGDIITCLKMESTNVDTYGLVGFKDKLMVGTYNESGGELYAWQPGQKPECIFTKGLDDPANRDIWSMALFQGQLFLGSWNTNGSKLYASQNGYDFKPIFKTNDPGRDYVRCLHVFKGSLYASFGRRGIPPRLVRISSEMAAEELFTPMEPPRSDIYEMKVFKSLLYLSVAAYHRDQEICGAEIWRFDGHNFERVQAAGFGNSNNIYVFSLEEHQGRLYAATYNYTEGAELWSTKDGHSWRCDCKGGFGRGKINECVIHSLKSFDKALYAGVRNPSQGFCLYRLEA
jgi:hypothetical protein